MRGAPSSRIRRARATWKAIRPRRAAGAGGPAVRSRAVTPKRARSSAGR